MPSGISFFAPGSHYDPSLPSTRPLCQKVFCASDFSEVFPVTPAAAGLPVTRKIGMGIVGLNFGAAILKEVSAGHPQSEMFHVVGITDLEKEKAARIAVLHGCRQFEDFDRMLESPEIEVVGIFTPPEKRASLISRAILAGKHVMTTKPFEASFDEAAVVLDLARRNRRVVHLNSPGPEIPPDIAWLLRQREALDLGLPVQCHCSVWASYSERPDGTWYDDLQACPVAPILRLGVYLINDLIDLFGNPETLEVVSSRVRTGRPTADNAIATMGFSGGMLASVAGSFCMDAEAPYQCNIEILCERGTLRREKFGSAGEEKARLSARVCVSSSPDIVLTETVEDPSGSYQWARLWQAVMRGGGNTPAYDQRILAGVNMIEALGVAERADGIAIRSSGIQQAITGNEEASPFRLAVAAVS